MALLCASRSNRLASLAVAGLLACSLAQAGPDCPAPAPRPVTPLTDGWSIATQNLWRLMDAHGRPGEAVPAPAAVEQRLVAISDYLGERLHWPHLVLVQEVENLALLQSLTDIIAARGGPRYRAWLIEGQDPSGIDVGALSRAPVRVAGMHALFGSARQGVHWLFSRPPLQLTLAEPVEMEVVVLHLRSGRGLDDPDRSAWVRDKRRAQARKVADWVRAQRQAGKRVLVAGDINSAPDAGVFSEPLQALMAVPLTSLWAQLPAAERFSYVYRCQPQAIDHLLATDNLLPLVESVQVSRGNAGHYRALHGSRGTEVVSDHDALMVWLELPMAEQASEASRD